MESKKILIYPFTVDTYPLAKLFIKRGIDVTFASPMGLSLVGKDLSHCVNRQKINKDVVSVDEALEDCNYDEILITTFDRYELIRSDLKKIIEYATCRNIKIRSLENIDLLECHINEMDKEGIKNVELMANNLSGINVNYYENVKAIVVFVVGLFETIDTNLISILTSECLSDCGYNVKIISTKREVLLNNGYNYPVDFFENKEIPQRIVSLNRFIQALEISQSPDIIIFDIPGGFLRNDEFWHNDFGIYSYLIGLAVNPDYIISTVPFNMVSDEFLNKLNEHVMRRFNKKVDIFNITNALFNNEHHPIEKVNRPIYTDFEVLTKNIMELTHNRTDVMCLDTVSDFIKLKNKFIEDLS